MKKKRLVDALALLTAVCVLTTSSVFGTSTEYNDNYYQTYGNLGADSAVPSLFKNDDVFANYKNYPPVISDGIEYVPLELFYGLSNVKINYSDDNSNFYIQNKETNEYISFNISDSYAVTGQNKVYETNVPTYYGVHYVPLRTVCDTVSIGCSTYNDGENKVYAANKRDYDREWVKKTIQPYIDVDFDLAGMDESFMQANHIVREEC